MPREVRDAACQALADIRTGSQPADVPADTANANANATSAATAAATMPQMVAGRSYSHAQLQAATGGLSPSHLLGRGGFGSVYRGMLDGTHVAVKVRGAARQRPAPLSPHHVRLTSAPIQPPASPCSAHACR